jgi:hypothetical protein
MSDQTREKSWNNSARIKFQIESVSGKRTATGAEMMVRPTDHLVKFLSRAETISPPNQRHSQPLGRWKIFPMDQALSGQNHFDFEFSFSRSFSSRTTRSMACCEVTPISLRYSASKY